MQIADLINGGFEIFGGIAMAGNVLKLYRDKKTRGVNWSTQIFFTSWGLWNLVYYPSLGQWVSLAGAASLVISNAFYVTLMWIYRKN